jgi:tetratricopeptide (TPR) repeat protein
VFSDPTQVTEEVDCYSALQCFGKAIEDYQQALALAPDDEIHLFEQPLSESDYTSFCQAYMFRGDWYKRLRDYEALQKNAVHALEHIPPIGVGADFIPAFHADIAHYHVACGLLFFQQQRYEQALASYQTAITTAGFGYYERGICYYQLAQYTEALHDFKTALSHCYSDEFDEDREPLMGWIEKCYQGLLDAQSTAHEMHVQHIRLEEHQRLTAELSAVLTHRTSTAIAVHQEPFTRPMPQAQEVFGIDLGNLRAKLESRSSSNTLKKASFELISAIIKIDQVGDIDPESAIGKARKVTEIVITDLHVQEFGQRGKDLFGMINSLYKQHVIPRRVYNYFETVRKFGNLTVHYHPQNLSDVTKDDVKIIGLITANIVQWYITEAKPP